MTKSGRTEPPFRVFDADEDFLVTDRKLPHWSQPGTLCYITLRTWDSMPKQVLERWARQRDQWLRDHGIQFGSHHAPRDESNAEKIPSYKKRRHSEQNPHHAERDDYRRLRSQLDQLSPKLRREFHDCVSRHWHDELDRCHGACVLRQPALAQIVAKSLKHFDGERYILTDFVVMPNHVHLLVAFQDAEQMLAQCESWKHYTATRINRNLGRKNRFWQQDGFDHLVRSTEQYHFLRRYIADNPKKANLRAGEFLHYQKSSHHAPRDEPSAQ